ALMVMNWASKASAMRRAMVVLPTPGGPQRMQLCGWPDSKARRSAMPSPSRCCCPMTSPSVRGRSCSARGAWAVAMLKPAPGSLADQVGPGRRLETEVAGFQARVGLPLAERELGALAQTVFDVEHRELLATQADAHAAQLAV